MSVMGWSSKRLYVWNHVCRLGQLVTLSYPWSKRRSNGSAEEYSFIVLISFRAPKYLGEHKYIFNLHKKWRLITLYGISVFGVVYVM